jgi:hypothetical protein
MTTLYELQQNAKDSLKEAMEWVLDAGDYTLDELDQDDIDLYDLIDSLVPVYTSDLMELASCHWEFRQVPDGDYDSMDEMIMVNVSDYLYEYMSEVFDEVKADLPQRPIDLLKSDDPRIVTQGKNLQFCPDERILELRDDYISGTGENISTDDWLDCWETADLDELENATADQISYLEQDDNGNWQVTD